MTTKFYQLMVLMGGLEGEAGESVPPSAEAAGTLGLGELRSGQG